MGSNCVAVEWDGKASARRMQTRKERTMARAHVMAGKSRPLARRNPGMCMVYTMVSSVLGITIFIMCVNSFVIHHRNALESSSHHLHYLGGYSLIARRGQWLGTPRQYM